MHINKTIYKQNYFCNKLRIKFGKLLTKSFPYNKIRIWGLKLCGFSVGEKVYIGEDLLVASPLSEKSCNLIIGNRVAIAPRVTIILSSDANWSRITEQIPPVKSNIILEDDCWIGAGVIILPGITIGKMSIVGAGAVVTKDVSPYSIVAGVPAKEIKNLK